MNNLLRQYKQSWHQDLAAGLVVFLVALPLCLGISLASGAPMFSGLIAGIIGGLVVAWASGSQLSVSGPAAGLTVIVFNAIQQLGNFNTFLFSVVLAGILQLVLGYMRLGVIGAFFPTSVIKGMLSAIGLILIIKQLPHATGYDASFDGDESYMDETASASFMDLFSALDGISIPVTIVGITSLLILIAWDTAPIKQNRWLSKVPGPLLVVLWGLALNEFAAVWLPDWAIKPQHLVSLPELGSISNFVRQLTFVDLSQWHNPAVYKIAATLAIIASLETLLSIEAVDKLDPLKRVAPTNRELKAQGIGNILSGLIGGLPITAVIVRSSANINAGGQTRLSCFWHGVFLLISTLFFAHQINMIPLSCLAAILLMTGYKLAKPSLFIEFYRKGWNQFLPFLITVTAILISDLLIGIVIGMVFGFFFVLKANFHAAMSLTQHNDHYLLRLHKDVSFLNKALLRKLLSQVANDSELIIDGTKALFIDHDIYEALADFCQSAPERNINVELQGIASRDLISSAH